MREASEIRRGLLEMLSTESSVFLATVLAVDEEAFSCTVMQKEGVNYYDVRLRSVINPRLNGMALIPKIGSYVLVCRIGESNELFVCQFSEIDKIIFSNENINFLVDNESVTADINGTTLDITDTGLVIENVENKIYFKLDSSEMELNVKGNTIDISGDTIVFNGGDNGGLVMIEELTSKINEFISTFNSHTHTITATLNFSDVAELVQATTSGNIDVLVNNNSVTPFERGNYENTTIKH